MRRICAVIFTGAVLAAGIVTSASPAQAPVASQPAATAVTFHKDVMPILQKNCQSCHRPGQIGPMPLTGYKEVRPWARAIMNAVVSKKMPPWPADPQRSVHFVNDRSLKQSDIDTIVTWATAGAPEGDAKDSPPPIQWAANGWNIQPDVVVELPPYQMSAKGIREWENLAIPAPFKEDTWVTSMELLPSDPSVVHHICWHFEKHRPTTVYNRYEWLEVNRDEDGVRTADNRGGAGQFGAEGILVTRNAGSEVTTKAPGRLGIRGGTAFCYVPGLTYDDYRNWGAGRLVPAGSDIILNIHYTANGKATLDRSKIGFTVAKTPPAKKFVQFGAVGGPPPDAAQAAARRAQVPNAQPGGRLEIPPFEGNYLAPPVDITFLKDAELVWLWPHMHLRGKSALYKLIYPDGREQVLLDVPRYDFNWQLAYLTSVKIPKGARLRVEMRFDNSTNNKFNPDPSRWVYTGDQTWEEMSTAGMGFIMDRDADETGFTTRFNIATGA